MKAKLKLDQKALQQFFLEHGEKIAFALILCGILWMVYEAVIHKGYEKVPNQLIESSETARQKIDRTPPNPPAEIENPPYEIIVNNMLSTSKVDEDRYPCTKRLEFPVAPPLSLRPKPPVFAATGLKGVAGFATFAIHPQPVADARPRRDLPSSGDKAGKRYVVVTAFVPLEEQIAAYERTFLDVAYKQPQHDARPQYLGFYVERAEVLPSEKSADPKWEPETSSVEVIWKERSHWARTDPEIVNLKHIAPQEGEGRFRDEEWGPAAARWSSRWVREPTDIGGRKSPMNRRFPWRSALNASSSPASPWKPRTSRTARRASGEEDVDRNPGLRPVEPIRMERTDASPPKYALLRFFDFTVDTGTMYRYRVSLVLRNPNYKVPAKHLKDSAFAKDTMLRTPWSEPSNVVYVPEDVRVLARNVPVPHPGGEPEATVMIMKWIQDSGVTAHEEFSKLMRGTLLDFPHRRFRAVPTSPRDRGMGDLERMSRDRRPSHSAPGAPRDYVPVDYITGATLVDIASDGPAGRILLVDEAGNLTAHNEIEDKAEFARWEEQQMPPDNSGMGLGGRGIAPRPPDGLDAFGREGRPRGNVRRP